MRLFIAINFDKHVRQELAASAAVLREHSISGNFTLENNYHITLSFLGDTVPEKTAQICGAMDECPAQSMTLTLGKCGCFGSGGSVIAWRAVKAPRQLWKLQENLQNRLLQRGFAPDLKKFKPHLTLARQLELQPGVSWDELNKLIMPFECTVESMELMKSERIKGRLTYSPLYSCRFR